jgi:crotonobetaine/carnitine-CoA ligase
VGVPTAWGDQEVRLFVVPEPGVAFVPDALARHLAEQLPEFMVPSSIVTLAELPTTHTHRPRKHELRDRPVTGEVWTRPSTAAGAPPQQTARPRTRSEA